MVVTHIVGFSEYASTICFCLLVVNKCTRPNLFLLICLHEPGCIKYVCRTWSVLSNIAYNALLCLLFYLSFSSYVMSGSHLLFLTSLFMFDLDCAHARLVYFIARKITVALLVVV